MRNILSNRRLLNWILVAVFAIAILIIARVCGIPIEFNVG